MTAFLSHDPEATEAHKYCVIRKRAQPRLQKEVHILILDHVDSRYINYFIRTKSFFRDYQICPYTYGFQWSTFRGSSSQIVDLVM